MRNPLRSYVHGIVELIYFLPIIVLISAWIVQPKTLFIWLLTLPLFYLIGHVVARLMQFQLRIFRMAALIVWPLVTGYFLHGPSLAAYGYVLFGLIAVYRGSLSFSRRYSELLPVTVPIIVLTAYFFASVFFRYTPTLEQYTLWIYVGGVLALVLVLFYSNREHLRTEAETGRRDRKVLNTAMLVYNRLYVALFLLIALAIALFRQIRLLFVRMKDAVIAWINRWLDRPGEPAPLHETMPEQQAPMLPFIGEVKEPSLWARALETVAMTVLYILMVAGALALLYFILKNAWKLSNRLWTWLVDRLNLRGARDEWNEWGYEDEKQSLIDWERLRKSASERLHNIGLRLAREPGWDKLQDNREKVRYLYKRWIRSAIKAGYEFKAHLTPKETERELKQEHRAPEKMVDAYVDARYGDKIPDDESLEQWRQKL